MKITKGKLREIIKEEVARSVKRKTTSVEEKAKRQEAVRKRLTEGFGVSETECFKRIDELLAVISDAYYAAETAMDVTDMDAWDLAEQMQEILGDYVR